MAVWVSMFNGAYSRYESRVQHRWGMEKYTPPIYVRDEYIPALDGSWIAHGAKIMSDLLAMAMIGLVITGIFLIENWHKLLVKRDAAWALQKIPAVLNVMQILVLDRIWFTVSRWLVEKENHKTKSHFINSWASKLFFCAHH